jgi:hypothetical protein
MSPETKGHLRNDRIFRLGVTLEALEPGDSQVRLLIVLQMRYLRGGQEVGRQREGFMGLPSLRAPSE